jgi:L-malate glycosyltransferase
VIRILHCHSTFSLGGKEARAVRLMNVFGDAAEHTILSAVPDAWGARDAIDPQIKVEFPGEAAPPLHGKPGLSRYRDLTAYMRQFDLVLTYNWGAMDAVGARRVFPKGCPPLIHHEDGFNADEAERLNWKRNAFRRLMLPTANALVVPSQMLEAVARNAWGQPDSRLRRIGNGIPTMDYAQPPLPDAIPGFTRRDGEIVIGTLAGLRPVKNLLRLVRIFAAISKPARLVIVGEGSERQTILAAAERLGIADRVHLPGFLPSPQTYLGLFDIFALTSDSEQFPISLVEAMATGLPVVCTDVGDIRQMLPSDQHHFISSPSDENKLAARLRQLANDRALRQALGTANRDHARQHFDESAMIADYVRLYANAVGVSPDYFQSSTA